MKHSTLPHPFHACKNGHGQDCEEFDCCHPCPMESALDAHLAFMSKYDHLEAPLDFVKKP